MAYGYYQQSGIPGWGTNQFQFGAPPVPSFQPQPTWGGTDFYRAHASTSDPYLFDHAWNRVREYGGAPAGGMGVGLHEARLWHRRAYAGLHEISLLQPNEIGHAAAYEAYRTWIHNSSIYEPLSGDIERQREALTGLAVAEASRLLQYSSRPADNYARLAASEAAAHTASYIFYQSRDGEHRSRSQYRQGGFDDPYAFDDALFSRARSRSGHRHRSHSRHGPLSQSGGMPFPQAYSSSSTSMGQTPFPGQPGSYSSYGGHTGGIHMPVHGTPFPHGVALPPGSAYSSSSMPMGMGINHSYSAPFPMDVAASYQGSALGVPYSRSRSSSFNYPQQAYSQQAYSQQAYPQQVYTQQGYAPTPYAMGSAMSSSSMPMGIPVTTQPTTIIIHKKKKHHKRSRSSEPDYHDRHHYSSSRY
ncbi:hypothetical protein BYT27DRAFT_7180403 [Phlegmacium glaucopus]|nr:hypothetical protein BYT27DRAFT_7180403 [Phlegmacium glaucopus]